MNILYRYRKEMIIKESTIKEPCQFAFANVQDSFFIRLWRSQKEGISFGCLKEDRDDLRKKQAGQHHCQKKQLYTNSSGQRCVVGKTSFLRRSYSAAVDH